MEKKSMLPMESNEIMKMCEETMPAPNGTLKLLFKQRPGEKDEDYTERIVRALNAQGERQARASHNLNRLLQNPPPLLAERLTAYQKLRSFFGKGLASLGN